jgi:hypothetical protein
MAYTTINKPSDYFNTITWTADGTSPRSFTGVGFQPDLVWGKRRSVAADHNLYDVVRGAGSDKALMSNATSEEGNASASFGYLSSLDSDGFTTTTGSTNNNYWNNGTDTYVAWNWLAGGTASSNTDGSITSSVSANTTSGFSIVSWTGNGNVASTVGHGLGSDLGMIIIKNRTDAEAWPVWHKNLTSTSDYRLLLNSTIAENLNTDFYSEAPTSSVFTPGGNNAINGSGDDMIAYCFADKKGYSKFGKYTGNGSADGTFVYTGFKPAFVIFKKTSSANDWIMKDSVREPNNQMAFRLKPNSSNAEDSLSGGQMDFLSNGFKFRVNDDVSNASGGTYIYMAFAENPLVGTNNIPATAR